MALATVPAAVVAQTVKLSRLGLDQGLSHEVVYDIVQDDEGFLWVATQLGLNRYDGRTFRSEWLTGAETSPVSYGPVRRVFVDHAGVLWAGVDGHGIFRFERETEEFHLVRMTKPDGEEVKALANVWDIVEQDGSLRVATSLGLAALDASGTLALRPRHGGDCGGSPTALWPSPRGALWVGTENGCLLIDGERPRSVDRLGGFVHEIAAGNGDTVWVAAEGSGLRRFDRDGAPLAPLPDGDSEGARSGAWSVLTDRFGETWVGTTGGLGRDPGPGSQWVTQTPPEDGGLPHDLVLHLYEDRQGVLWIGTWSGLARLSPTRRFLEFLPGSSLERSGGGVVGIAEAPNGDIWFGGMSGRLTRLDASRAGRAVVVQGPENASGGVFSIALPSDDEIWIAVAGAGLHRRSAGSWISYRERPPRGGSLPDDYVVAVLVDRAGTVWAGSSRQGLLVFDEAANGFRRYLGPDQDFDYLAPYVWPIAEDAQGYLWFGANGVEGGLHALDPDRRRLYTYPTGHTVTRVPNSGRVISLELSGDTLVWFGTQGGGLGRLDRRDPSSIRMLTQDDGLPNARVGGIVEDRFGYVWVSTDGGLARFDPSARSFWVLREGSGLQSNQFRYTSTYDAGDGRIYFGGANGVTVIDPSAAVPPAEPPQAGLTRFSVLGEVRPELNNLTAHRGLELGARERFFTLELAALDFTDVSLNEFRYRLDPLEESWVDGGTNPVANYTSVPPGRYTFLAEVRNGAGVWSSGGLAIPIRVAPYPHEDVRYWIAASLLLVGLLVAGVRRKILLERGEAESRLARIREREHERRDMLRQLRADILSALHSDIGADLGTIVLKAGTVRSAVDTDLIRRMGGQIEDLARSAMRTVRSLLTVIDESRDTVSGLAGQLEDQTGRLLDGVIEDYRLDVDDRVKGSVLPMDMELRSHVVDCYKEALQNVQKHARATTVHARITLEGSDLVITVKDDGVGFDVTRVEPGHGLAQFARFNSNDSLRVAYDSRVGSGTRCRIAVHVGRARRAQGRHARGA